MTLTRNAAFLAASLLALIPALSRAAPVPQPAVEMPDSDRMFPAGPGSDAVTNNCLACHSAGMVLTQPKLTRAQWTETVGKMIHVYKAPVDPADVPAIIDYLAALDPVP